MLSFGVTGLTLLVFRLDVELYDTGSPIKYPAVFNVGTYYCPYPKADKSVRVLSREFNEETL